MGQLAFRDDTEDLAVEAYFFGARQLVVRQDQDRQVASERIPPELGDDAEPVEIRHEDVAHDEVDRAATRGLDALQPPARSDDLVAGRTKGGIDEVEGRRVVVDGEDAESRGLAR